MATIRTCLDFFFRLFVFCCVSLIVFSATREIFDCYLIRQFSSHTQLENEKCAKKMCAHENNTTVYWPIKNGWIIMLRILLHFFPTSVRFFLVNSSGYLPLQQTPTGSTEQIISTSLPYIFHSISDVIHFYSFHELFETINSLLQSTHYCKIQLKSLWLRVFFNYNFSRLMLIRN